MSNASTDIFAAPSRQRRGFTLVELMLGLLVTSLVMAALSLLLAAVGQGWKQSEATQEGATMTSQVHLRIQKCLKSAALIGVIRPGSIDNMAPQSAAMLIWKNDANRDWKIQFSEMALIEYDKDAGELLYYQADFSGMSAAAAADNDTTLPSNNSLYDDARIAQFKGSYVSYTKLARNVIGCAFHKNDAYTAVRPAIDYIFKITGPTGTETDYGTVALRTPATMPVQQR
jgi:type II secretory pathway pseudopilin PulG